MPNYPTGRFDSFFFDMDQTLTRSKTEIMDYHFKLLYRLTTIAPVYFVSGATLPQMLKQLILIDATYMAQNGNHAVAPDGEMLWLNELYPEEVDAIYGHMEKVSRHYKWKMNDHTIENRGCQVSFSAVGHESPRDEKELYDPFREKRQTILRVIPFEHPTLTVRIGGTTCFDYTHKNGTKGKNVKHMIEDCALQNPVYIGDALFKGGNDETVVGVCKTYQVRDVEETFEFIKSRL